MDTVQTESNKAVGGERDISLRMTMCGCLAAAGMGVRCDNSSPNPSMWGHILAPLDPHQLIHFVGSPALGHRRPRNPVRGHLERKFMLFSLGVYTETSHDPSHGSNLTLQIPSEI